MSASRSSLFDIDLFVHHETERAIFASEDGEITNAKWFPLSQVELSPCAGGQPEIKNFTMPTWLAKEKGLI